MGIDGDWFLIKRIQHGMLVIYEYLEVFQLKRKIRIRYE